MGGIRAAVFHRSTFAPVGKEHPEEGYLNVGPLSVQTKSRDEARTLAIAIRDMLYLLNSLYGSLH